jgi:hypothetical protein
MKKELQDQLYNKYPKLFGQKDLPMTQTCMCWGIETGSGWYSIIDNACRIIQWHIDQSRKNRAMALAYNRRLQKAIDGNTTDLSRFYDKLYSDKTQISERVKQEVERKQFRPVDAAIPQIQFVQIKEKFGTLRMYTNGYDDYIDGVIAMAESMSAITCEECGKPGKLRGGGWYYTACDEHTKESDLNNGEEDDDE